MSKAQLGFGFVKSAHEKVDDRDSSDCPEPGCSRKRARRELRSGEEVNTRYCGFHAIERKHAMQRKYQEPCTCNVCVQARAERQKARSGR